MYDLSYARIKRAQLCAHIALSMHIYVRLSSKRVAHDLCDHGGGSLDVIGPFVLFQNHCFSLRQ